MIKRLIEWLSFHFLAEDKKDENFKMTYHMMFQKDEQELFLIITQYSRTKFLVFKRWLTTSKQFSYVPWFLIELLKERINIEVEWDKAYLDNYTKNIVPSVKERTKTQINAIKENENIDQLNKNNILASLDEDMKELQGAMKALSAKEKQLLATFLKQDYVFVGRDDKVVANDYYLIKDIGDEGFIMIKVFAFNKKDELILVDVQQTNLKVNIIDKLVTKHNVELIKAYKGGK